MKTLKNLVSTIVIALIISVSLLLFYLGWTNRLSSEILLPLLAIVGVVCLLTTLTFAAVVFAKVGVADKTQALALPEGSVRAVDRAFPNRHLRDCVGLSVWRTSQW